MKVRIWETRSGKGRYRYVVKDLDLSCSAYNPPDLPNQTRNEEHHETFSGAKDKNGRDIFENDIATSAQGVGLVLKTENGFEFRTGQSTSPLWQMTVGRDGNLFEIIGNINETPELLPESIDRE